MLRQDTIICGTSTTGTGTLTLAACPNPPGGVDPYKWLTAAGYNFTSGNAVGASYVIIEYSDTTFSQAVNFEKGVGTITLGASLAATTLARTTVQSAAATLNATGTPSYQSPSAISIGTAANVLVFVGPSAVDLPAFSPYYETEIGDDLGLTPVIVGGGSAIAAGGVLASLTDYYSVFEWRVPMLVKRCSTRVSQAYGGTSGTPVSAAYARLYQINPSGRPGKLLVDFGAFAGTNPLNATGLISTTALSTGFMLAPGHYFFDFLPSFSGASGTVTSPKLECSLYTLGQGIMGTSNLQPYQQTTATSGTAGAAPDPAELTGYAGALTYYANYFALNVS